MKSSFFLFTTIILFATFLINPIFPEPKPYIVASQQKAGSHLLIKLLGMLGEYRHPAFFFHLDEDNFSSTMIEECWQEGRLPWVHLFCPEMTREYFYNHHAQFKVISIIRDIRDAYVSFANMVYKKNPQLTEQEKIDLAFNFKDYFRMSHNLSLFLNDPRFYVVRFEDLVGPKGGGDKKRQTQAIYDLAAYIGVPISYAQASKYGDKLFGGKTITFRKGQIGSWKKACSREQKLWLKEHFGDELINLGYEEDHSW